MKEIIYKQDAIDALNKLDVSDGVGISSIACNLQEEAIRSIKNLQPAQPEQQHGRIFKEIVVEYPLYNIYLEYEGKPYFSIKYTENGQEFIGYGTYKPEVLSEYLKEYFMPSVQPEVKVLRVPCTEKPTDIFNALTEEEKQQNRWYVEGYCDAIKEMNEKTKEASV